VFALSQVEGLWYVTFEYFGQEMPVSAPLALFEIIDAKVPPSWNIRVLAEGLSLQPIELDDEFFCDDVQERRGDALERYRAMKARLIGANDVRALIERFLNGDDRSLRFAGELESALERMGDREPFASAALALASYRPDGGPYLRDEASVIPILELALQALDEAPR
jgi:hypothetical protein